MPQLPRDEQPPEQPTPVEQAPVPTLASSDDAAPSEAVKAVVLVLRSPNVGAFRVHITEQVEVIDPDKSDGSTKFVEVEVPVDITPAGTEVSPGVVDKILTAALDAGLVVTEKG